MKFEMNIKDVFHFGNGKTVFLGQVVASENRIGSCRCELTIDGEVKNVVEIEGEMIGGSHPEGYRSVSSGEPVELDKQLVADSDCRLRVVA